ncbi:Replication-relaxation [Streptomyces noursei ATCC 11455]|nr:Replication-relaxation [Streptomyces noursei ATCC 11455]ANZ21963.1 Replication-relaxation [Streptomyces noursei ATCC 11455]
MFTSSPTAFSHRPTPVREQALAALFVHRAAETDQLRRLLSPPPELRYFRHCLRDLQRQGVLSSVKRAHHPSVWSLTKDGAHLVANWPEFAGQRRVRRHTALGARTAHTLAVTRTALAFVEDARRRGDEVTPLDWSPEVAHPVRDGAGDGDRALIADALLRYTRTAPTRAMLRAFVEVDRATESSERLASKVITYARFHNHVSVSGRREVADVSGMRAWQRTYPVFPRLLFVLTGAGRKALLHRVADLRALVREHPATARFAEEVPSGAAVLEELETQGASAAVWWPLDDRVGRRSWMEL